MYDQPLFLSKDTIICWLESIRLPTIKPVKIFSDLFNFSSTAYSSIRNRRLLIFWNFHLDILIPAPSPLIINLSHCYSQIIILVFEKMSTSDDLLLDPWPKTGESYEFSPIHPSVCWEIFLRIGTLVFSDILD